MISIDKKPKNEDILALENLITKNKRLNINKRKSLFTINN